MERITDNILKLRFQFFCKAMGKRVATSYNDVGAYRLNKTMGYYNIEEIVNDKGEVRNPIFYSRYTKREMCDILYFVTQALIES